MCISEPELRTALLPCETLALWLAADELLRLARLALRLAGAELLLLLLTFALRLAGEELLLLLTFALRLAAGAEPREVFAADLDALPALLRTDSLAWFEELDALLCPHASLPRAANITKMLRTNANLTNLFMILVFNGY